MRVPRDVQELSARISIARDRLTRELGRSPTVAELARAAEAGVEQTASRRRSAPPTPTARCRSTSRWARVWTRWTRSAATTTASSAWSSATMLRSTGCTHLPPARARDPAPAVLRGPHAARDRRSRRRLADARLAADPPVDRGACASGSSGRSACRPPDRRVASGSWQTATRSEDEERVRAQLAPPARAAPGDPRRHGRRPDPVRLSAGGAVPQRFETISSFQRHVFLAVLVCTALSSALLIAPTALHRLLFRRGHKPEIIEYANRMAIVWPDHARGRDHRRGAAAHPPASSAPGPRSRSPSPIGAVILITWFVIPLARRGDPL